MHPALRSLVEATRGTPFDGRLFLVGGAVRDELLGLDNRADYDLVLEGNALRLAWLLWETRVCEGPPVVFSRFGTAMVRVLGAQIELITARKESYEAMSRKPDVEPATLHEDALRRDFTVNALMRNLHTWELLDLLGQGLADLEAKVLRTPLEPERTFYDDPLRMLRAVRFRWKLGFEYAPGLEDSIRGQAHRLSIISMERVRDELVKMLSQPNADRCLQDLLDLNLLAQFAPELVEMAGVEQGDFHHEDVWGHSLSVVRKVGPTDMPLALAALLHDVGKPRTRQLDAKGHIRFFDHQCLGERMTGEVLRRLRFSASEIATVKHLVRNHMRLTGVQRFTEAGARRLIRDLGEDLPRLLALVEADAASLRPGLKTMDVGRIRALIDEVASHTPPQQIQSPLSGLEIMCAMGVVEGPIIGLVKQFLTEEVIEGRLAPGDKLGATQMARAFLRRVPEGRGTNSGI